MKNKFTKALYCFAVIFGMLLSPVLSEGNEAELSILMPQTQTEETQTEAEEIIEIHVPTIDDFTDVADDKWYYIYVKYLVENGILNGTSQTTYSPDGTFTVAECCAIVTRYLGLDEYAKERKELLSDSATPGCELWYSGYVQTMLELGILESKDFDITEKGELFAINSSDKFDTPISRELFAHLIIRSFELEGKTLRARNTYYELGGLGHEFIIAGTYDKESYLLYASDISDYWHISEPYRVSVLKAYYNGIFNGDNFGNFNPQNNLTRAEMSKVLSVILDGSLRQRKEYRNLPSSCVLSEEDYYIGATGEQLISKKKGKEILLELSKNVAASASSGKITLTYTHKNILPEGYFADVSFYGISNDGTACESSMGANTNGAQLSPYVMTDTFSANEAQVLLLLRSSSKKGTVESALMLNVSNDGTTSISDMFYSAK